jgi:acyl dehydratase
MALERLEGTTYGPFVLRISASKVAEYVSATRDDGDRWVATAPPSFAGALLFVAAPSFLHSDDVKARSRVLVHADQTFTWHHPLLVGAEVTVDAHLARVRARGPVDFVTFDAVVRHENDIWLDSRSTFLLGAEAGGDPVSEREEPAVGEAARNDAAPDGDSGRLEMRRSASRLDLVRYAAASGDFNPIHFDHATGVGAGFGGTIVHGLLMAAWLTSLAVVRTTGDAPIATAKYRFRRALYPAAQATASAEFGAVEATGRRVDLRLAEGADLVTARATVRGG